MQRQCIYTIITKCHISVAEAYKPECSVEEEVERFRDEQVVADVSETTLELLTTE